MSLNIPEHLPFIRSISELAALVHASPKLLYRISNHSEDFYRITTIPKRNGDERTIEESVKKLTESSGLPSGSNSIREGAKHKR